MVKRKNLIDWIIQNRVVSHIIFWVLLFISLPILAILNDGSLEKTTISSLAYLPAQLLASYFLVYYQVPRLLSKKKYLKFGVSFLISVYVFTVIAKLLSGYFSELFLHKNHHQESLIEILGSCLLYTSPSPRDRG